MHRLGGALPCTGARTREYLVELLALPVESGVQIVQVGPDDGDGGVRYRAETHGVAMRRGVGYGDGTGGIDHGGRV